MKPETLLEQNTYLAIPYDKRIEAMKFIGKLANGENVLGFDKDQNLWFAKAGTPLTKVEPWLPRPELFGAPTHQDPITEFSQVLASSGFVLHEPPIFDGQKHRVATQDDKRGQKSGVYCGYGDAHPAGWYQDHRNHSEPQKWRASFTHSDPLAKLHIKAQQANNRTLREITESKRYQHHANRCYQAFQLMPQAKVEHPYLVKKDVQAFPDVMQDKKGRLVIPLMDENHKIHSLQRISPNGFKCLKKGAQKAGHFFVVGYKPLKNGEPILYAEGYATAASIAEATGRSVVMTVDAGNMPKVAQTLHAHYPNSQHLFLADDDRNNKSNKGLEMAQKAANITCGRWLAPYFIQDQIEVGMTDFNDLHISSGLAVVKTQIEGFIERSWPHLHKLKSQGASSIEIIEQAALQAEKLKPANKTLSEKLTPLTDITKPLIKNDSSNTGGETHQNQKAKFPDSIAKHYIALENKYYFQNRPKCLAFIDKGSKLQTKLANAQLVNDLIDIAKQRQWQDIKISGSKAFKSQAWLQASLHGIRVRGYRPDKTEVQQLMTMQAKAAKQKTIQPNANIQEVQSPVNTIEATHLDSSNTTLQKAQTFCKDLPPEAQQQFLDKVKQRLDSLFQKPQMNIPNSSPSNHREIKEPEHEQALEH
ncbi:hypothetical protein JQC92_01585 [Shewanella sp. 202IG2-18]|uniref:LPD7 domain-containing protein n=1 Tax=Parashewanella hymeniacidonis TaxID=2807618 RepID=UPI00195F292C|nr:LPD7 domain-containing protein [Parashewanella hymeniacidonis]MBM7070735.1 hypothetical protein [Parashewanella hymeniacidonis]